LPPAAVLQASALLSAAVLAALAAPVAAASRSASCEWRAPAADPYVGEVPAAVDSYTDIPPATRARLKARLREFAYDDIVAIRRDAIEGRYRYEPALLDMHFGKGRLCAKVTRQSWRPEHEERGLAYCEDGHCIVVPLVCRNVSRIVRRAAVAMLGAPGEPVLPLLFDAPSAGLWPGLTPVPDAAPSTRRLQAGPPGIGRIPPASDLPPAAVPLQPLPAGPEPGADNPPWTLPPEPPELPPIVPAPPQGPAPPPLEPRPPSPELPPTGVPPLPPAVPEPASLLLWLAALAAGLAWRRRKSTPGDRHAQR